MSDSKLQSLGSLGSKAKQIVANVAKNFLQESKKETPPAFYTRQTVEATGVSRTTVFKIRTEQMDTGVLTPEVTKTFRQGTLQASRLLWSDCYKEQDAGVLQPFADSYRLSKVYMKFWKPMLMQTKANGSLHRRTWRLLHYQLGRRILWWLRQLYGNGQWRRMKWRFFSPFCKLFSVYYRMK